MADDSHDEVEAHELIRKLEDQIDAEQAMIFEILDRGEAIAVENTHLKIALDSARMIGAAVGIVMATQKINYEAAFTVLRKASQHSHRKLRDIADEVLMTGAVPAQPVSMQPARIAAALSRENATRLETRTRDDDAP